MKVVIIGAGIAGCAAYLELEKHLPKSLVSEEKHEITIFEAYSTDLKVTPEQRKEDHTQSATLLVGGGIGIAPNGLNVLRRLDEELLNDVVRGGYAISTSNMKNKNGSLLMSIKPSLSNPSSKDNTESPQQMLTVGCSRHSLWKCLRARIPDEHIVNKRVSDVVSCADGRNLIHFADGSPSVEADLVVGADGVRSTAKGAILPDAEGDTYSPYYEGVVGVGGFIPAADFKGLIEKGSMNFIFGGNGFFGYFFSDSATSALKRDSPYHVSEPGETLAWWSTYEIENSPDHKSLDMADVTRQLRERHGHWKDPVVQKVIQSVHVTHMYPTWTSPPLPTWERDGVVLVGDAAHALPSTSGQGSSQALEDVECFALLLAHYFRKESHSQKITGPKELKCMIKAVAERYMALRQPRVEKILEAARRIQKNKADMGVIREYTMYAFMKIMGCFPSLMLNQVRRMTDYNIAKHVAQVIGAETETQSS